MIDYGDDEAAAEAARQLIDGCEQEMLAKGVGMDTIDQFAHAHRVQAQIEAKMGVDRMKTERERQFGEARDRREVAEQLWASFQEAQRYLRRSTMSAASKSAVINRYGLANYFRLPL